jgi:hypothetical protein
MSPAYDRIKRQDAEYLDQPLVRDGEVEKQTNETTHCAAASRYSKLQQVREIILAIASLICLWIVLVTAWRSTLHPIPRTIRYEKRTLSCGNTTAEAESRGCAFDLLSHNWVAPPCLDPLTESEYREYVSSPERTFGPYPYYLDTKGEHHISDERSFALLANGPTLAEQQVYTTREEHLAHCSFLMRRNHRAAEGKVRLNDENSQFWHTEHCIKEIGNPNKKPMDALNEGFYVGFAPCTIEVSV